MCSKAKVARKVRKNQQPAEVKIGRRRNEDKGGGLEGVKVGGCACGESVGRVGRVG